MGVFAVLLAYLFGVIVVVVELSIDNNTVPNQERNGGSRPLKIRIPASLPKYASSTDRINPRSDFLSFLSLLALWLSSSSSSSYMVRNAGSLSYDGL